MPRSLAHGDYSLVLAVESSSRANSWYRVLRDRQHQQLSCDCPAWIFRQEGGTQRSCKHTRLAETIISRGQKGTPIERARGRAAENNVLVHATQQQWPGLGGSWMIEQTAVAIDNNPYRLIEMQLKTGSELITSGAVAFAQRFHPGRESMIAGVAGWIGYAIAAGVARSAGYPLAGQPPDHFRVTRGRRRTGQGPDVLGLTDILRVGDQVHLGDGYTPAQRAENTLRLFLGETLYARLEQQHFLDVSSTLYAAQQRVYRIRRDPEKQYERRVRVFEGGHYTYDYCIVRGQQVPEADHWLTVFLRLISDEAGILSVVREYNVFPPYSDGLEQEQVPAIWQARAA